MMEDFMKQLLLIDANSMVFRAYYATAYGRMMTTSSGQPTNALYGFANMVFKALDMIEPDKVLFAFDSKAKTFRHKQYEAYKGTRSELPQELIDQFALVREYLDEFDVIRYEIDGYEADDIIGTMVSTYAVSKKIILTSDRDLLQLIDENTSVLLMKKGISETQLVDLETLKSEQGLIPSQIIDLKSLMGDASDNIPGVSGVGEKTAKKLLEQYNTLDGVYAHIHELKGKLKERLETQKEQAYLSYELATIYRSVPLEFNEKQLIFNPNWQQTAKFFRTYEMESMVEYISKFENEKQDQEEMKWVDFNADNFQDISIILASNYSQSETEKTCDGFIVYSASALSVIDYNQLDDSFKKWAQSDTSKIAFDAKTLYHLAFNRDFEINNIVDDVWLMAFLEDTSLTSLDKIKDKWQITINKDDKLSSDLEFAKLAFDKYNALYEMLSENHLLDLYKNIEFELIEPLYMMEKQGVSVDLDTLNEINEQTFKK